MESNREVDFTIVLESANFVHILVKGLYGLGIYHRQWLLDNHNIKILEKLDGYGHYLGEKVNTNTTWMPYFWSAPEWRDNFQGRY
jgi:hypothetical protein